MIQPALLEPVMVKQDLAEIALEYELPLPDLTHIITDDGAPVDNLHSERNMRLLTDTLYTSWPGPGDGRPFLAYANVGLFYSVNKPPLVPDVLVSLDTIPPHEFIPDDKYTHSYFVWYHGKPPDVVIEIVSNKIGREEGFKRNKYAQLGITYYVVFDPEHHLNKESLRVYELHGGQYALTKQPWLSQVRLGLTLWEGDYQGVTKTWLRWVDVDNNLLLTGAELAEWQRSRAEQERSRAEWEHDRAEQERNRAEAEHRLVEKLMAQLQQAGIEPERL